mmetsp:Transcript_15523/g.31893  ORF Transcript_15523/g.31893 Transcript_15523/m.31893 type:complete len:201 (-) Transcript_15523:1059-1661(-)
MALESPNSSWIISSLLNFMLIFMLLPSEKLFDRVKDWPEPLLSEPGNSNPIDESGSGDLVLSPSIIVEERKPLLIEPFIRLELSKPNLLFEPLNTGPLDAIVLLLELIRLLSRKLFVFDMLDLFDKLDLKELLWFLPVPLPAVSELKSSLVLLPPIGSWNAIPNASFSSRRYCGCCILGPGLDNASHTLCDIEPILYVED